MGTEQAVAQHYTHGALERVVLDALRAAGKDPDRLEPSDLAPVDEFHIGGRQATIDLAGELRVTRGMHLLDIGSGLGGASRYFVHACGCTVTGIDLTEEYVRVAQALSVRTGLAGQVSAAASIRLSDEISASVANVVTGATGPKISSVKAAMSGRTPDSTVGR